MTEVLLLCLALAGNSPAAPAQDTQPSAEMTLRETPATFKIRVNLVMVPVIVRDGTGKAVGDLKQEDFQLFDRGKPQVISKFSIERPGAQAGRRRLAPEAVPLEAAEPLSTTLAATPERYIAFLFDDIHASFEDLSRSRDAAAKFLAAGLKPTDRAAIFSTSGRTTQPFTDDRAKLRDALMLLKPSPIAKVVSGHQCPTLDYYLADLIENKHDDQALNAVIAETIACAGLDGRSARQAAESIVRSAVMRELSSGEQETRVALSTLRDAVRAISVMPGQRTVILASPGFLTPNNQHETADVIDRAIQANVIISSLDARGLYVVDVLGDISSPTTIQPQSAGVRAQIAYASASQQAEVLADLAAGTGGAFFRNSNDLGAGFERLAAAPEIVYMLGFSPQNLRMDGNFHGLKVSLKTRNKGLVLQARRGYYAPKRQTDAAEAAKREIEEALFSRDEMNDIPVEVHTQFFKIGDVNARVAVLARVTLNHLPFKKVDGRNLDDLTVLAALFDRNGNYVTGEKKLVEMRLLDRTLENKQRSAITLKSNFDVAPGGYMVRVVVRVVVRDSEGQLMAAQNGAVEIP